MVNILNNASSYLCITYPWIYYLLYSHIQTDKVDGDGVNYFPHIFFPLSLKIVCLFVSDVIVWKNGFSYCCFLYD